MPRPKPKLIPLLLVALLGTGFSFSLPHFQLSPYARYRLSRLPLIGRLIKPPVPPEKEYRAAQSLMEKLRDQEADRYAPELYARVEKKWERARTYYRTGHYDWARIYFAQIQDLGKKALEEARRRREALKARAYKTLNLLRQSYRKKSRTLPPEKRLQITLALWRLETLIQLEDFETFKKEALEVRRNYGL